MKTAIIRGNDVLLSGKICLGPGASVVPVRNGETPPQANAGTVAEAKVVESTEDYVLVEIQCKCGETVQLKCNFADLGI